MLPSNEGRGYVLRRIMRRAMRHAELLGAKDPLMWRLVPALVREMGQAYPELHRAEALITETLKLEETRFRKTLERGLAILDDATQVAQEGRHVRRRDRVHALRHLRLSARSDPGRAASRAASASISRAFTDAMERQRTKARASWAGSGEAADEAVWFALREKARRHRFPRLRDRDRRRRRRRAGARRQGGAALQKGESGAVVFNQTPFYAESGGQVGDTGAMTGDGVRFAVTDTQKRAGDVFVHIVTVEQGALKAGTALDARRSITRAAAPSGKIIRRRICCTRRCARCLAITWRRRARWSRPTGCASISRTRSR